jgi:hypothetical protein
MVSSDAGVGMRGSRPIRCAALIVVASVIAGCASPVPSPRAPVPPGLRVLSWSVLNALAWPPEQDLAAIAPRTDGGFLAAAWNNGVTMLTSRDGRSWTALPDENGALRSAIGTRFVVVNGASERGGTAVAVGADALDDASAGDARAWISTDGSRWRIVASGAAERDATMNAVAAGPSGFVAVGSDGYPGPNVQLAGSRGAAAWVSADGQHWTRAPAQAALEGSIMVGVIAASSGYVAWGEGIPNIIERVTPPVWTSTDGLTWTRSRVEGTRPEQMMPVRAIVAVPGTLIAVGVLPDPAHGDGAVPAAWTSADGGATWRRATVTVPQPSVTGTLRAVAFDGSILLAIGMEDMPGASTARVVPWQSVDHGVTWIRLPNDRALANAHADTVIAVPGGFAVFGAADDPDALSERHLEWIAAP